MQIQDMVLRDGFWTTMADLDAFNRLSVRLLITDAQKRPSG